MLIKKTLKRVYNSKVSKGQELLTVMMRAVVELDELGVRRVEAFRLQEPDVRTGH